jgi:hypothetical protein
VYFDRSVLDRYFADPARFKVADGIVFGPGWSLSTDDGRPDVISVFLGDLGQSLSAREQKQWRAHNIIGDCKLSDAAYSRSILGEMADTERVEHRFYTAYENLQQAWEAKFGWRLFHTPNDGDAHIMYTIHLPANQSGQAFDQQIVLLAKLVADALNDVELAKALDGTVANEKGIAKFERLLSQLGYDLPALPKLMAWIYGARTRSAAHFKSSTYDEEKLLDGAANLPALFERYLNNLADLFDQLRTLLQTPDQPRAATSVVAG